MNKRQAATIRVCRLAQKNGGNMNAAIKQHAKEIGVKPSQLKKQVDKTIGKKA